MNERTGRRPPSRRRVDRTGSATVHGDTAVPGDSTQATGAPAPTDAAASEPVDAGDAPAVGATARSTAVRLARVHLRLGALSLARAELESLAGRGLLDEAALVDLAEVRWRTGDLAGAGEATTTLLERGCTDAMALVIAAEAVAAQGRPGEARRLVGMAVAALDGSLDAVFAGMPRNAPWPGAPAAVAPAPAAPVAPVGVAGHPVAASASAAEAYAGGRAALAAGDPGQTTRAALQLGVALRLDPGFATAVLDAIGVRASEPELALVAGDALRLLGREPEALAAYEVAGDAGASFGAAAATAAGVDEPG